MSSLDFERVFSPTKVLQLSNGLLSNQNGTLLDLSGNGLDVSGVAILKIAPIDSTNSYYTLFDLSNNFINNVDCSGANLIRVKNSSVKPVGYISNASAVSAFTTDSSGNLWVGGNAMNVKANYSDVSVITNTESMFIVPNVDAPAPTAFINVDVSGCNNICRVNNVMVATVTDVSGVCRNFAASGSTVTIDNTIVLPRIESKTAAFSVTTAPSAGGVEVSANMDLSGHRLVAFTRSGDAGRDVSGFYVVRSNGASNTASSVDGASAGGNGENIKWDLALNNMAYDSDRNNLYVGSNRGVNASSDLLIVPLNHSTNVFQGFDVSANALLSYARATSSTSSAVDASGYMVVCANPTNSGNINIKLDSSGHAFDTITLLDVSGVNAMATVVAADASGNNQNFLFLVDASRNAISGENLSAYGKLAKLTINSRESNASKEAQFVAGVVTESNRSRSYVKDIAVSDNNVILGGHQINTTLSTLTETEITRTYGSIPVLNISYITSLQNQAALKDFDKLTSNFSNMN